MKLLGSEQLDNLIVWMARVTKGYGGTVDRIAENARASGCSRSNRPQHYPPRVLKRFHKRDHHRGKTALDFLAATLTFAGWDRYETIKRGATNSRLAFMAMKFGNTETERIYVDFFKPAVAKTGFELRRNDEAQRAGLIDDLMRVQIRQSRFVISSYGSQQWRVLGGRICRGLGKPVIYTAVTTLTAPISERTSTQTIT
jgi:hypothetical protein